jgi:hypothetical protein
MGQPPVIGIAPKPDAAERAFARQPGKEMPVARIAIIAKQRTAGAAPSAEASRFRNCRCDVDQLALFV